MNNDLISREALKKALNFVYDCAYIDSKSKEGIASDIIAEIDNAPTVEDRPQGIWVDSPDGLPKCCCSLCGAKNVTIWHSFCPNCGAKIQDG